MMEWAMEKTFTTYAVILMNVLSEIRWLCNAYCLTTHPTDKMVHEMELSWKNLTEKSMCLWQLTARTKMSSKGFFSLVRKSYFLSAAAQLQKGHQLLKWTTAYKDEHSTNPIIPSHEWENAFIGKERNEWNQWNKFTVPCACSFPPVGGVWAISLSVGQLFFITYRQRISQLDSEDLQRVFLTESVRRSGGKTVSTKLAK